MSLSCHSSHPPVTSATPEQEVAARALLGEAEKLIEFELPQEAKQESLLILDRLQQDYPDYDAADPLEFNYYSDSGAYSRAGVLPACSLGDLLW